MNGLVFYTVISNSNLHRYFHGYDKCGDTCGLVNTPNSLAKCSGKDLTDKNFIQYQILTRDNVTKVFGDQCVEKCPPESLKIFHKCLPRSHNGTKIVVDLLEFANDLIKGFFPIIFPIIMITIVCSILFYLSLYYHPTFTILSAVISSLCVYLLATVLAWYYYVITKAPLLLVFSIFVTIYLLLLIVIVWYIATNYKEISQLFREAINTIVDTLALLLLPLAIGHLFAVAIATFTFFFILLSTNQTLRQSDFDKSIYEYQVTTIAIAVICYMGVIFLWGYFITDACQVVIVAICVGSHYFQRDPALRYGLLKSCYILVRYHLGSVMFGAFCITALAIARIFIKMQDSARSNWLIIILAIICRCFQDFLEYFARRAYLQIAFHGMPLFKSGVRAARLLWINLMDTVKLDIFGNFILISTGSLILTIAVGIVFLAHYISETDYIYFWGVALVGAAVSGGILYLCFIVITISVTTIFMCYCEDKSFNDGKTRPYWMPKHVDNLLEEAKKKAKQESN